MRWFLSLLLISIQAVAVDFDWISTGGGVWTDAANWSQPSFPNAGNADVRFLGAITGPATINVNGTFTVDDFFFNNAFSYTLNGGTLLSIDDFTVTQGNHTINTNLVKGGGSTCNVAAGASLTLNGVISGSGNIVKTNSGTLTVGGSSSNTFTAVMRVNGGTVVFNKTPGANAVGGNVFLNSATLRMDQDDQFPSTSTVTIDDNPSVFDLNGTTQTMSRLDFENGTFNGGGGTINLTRNGTSAALIIEGTELGDAQINLTGNTTFGVDHNGNTSSTLSANLDLGSVDRRIDAGGSQVVDLTISGVISGSAGLIRNGGGVRLSGNLPNTYSGTTTIISGVTHLNKSDGVNAIPGNIQHNNGTVILETPNQIDDSAIYNLAGGTLNMNSQAETFTRLNFTGGSLSNNSSLTLTSTDVALLIENEVIGGQLNLTGATGGKVIRDSTGNSTASLENVDLGSAIREFEIQNGTATDDMAIIGVISGAGGITKTEAGRLDFRGSATNTYSGLTTLEEGDLQLSKTGGAIAIAGDLVINAGRVEYVNPAQISSTSNVTLNGGIFELDNLIVTETLGSFTFNGGTFLDNNGLILTSTGMALTMRDTTITELVSLSGASGGDVVFDATNGGTATLDDLDLGGAVRRFLIANGAAQTDMEITGVISGNGGIDKEGLGQLELSGAAPNTYMGVTTISEGALFLNKDPSTTAIGGPVIIEGGTLFSGNTEQISDSQSVTQNGGAWNLNGNNETVASYSFQEGTFNQSGATLSLGGTGTVLLMNGTVIPETVVFTTLTSTTVQTGPSSSLASIGAIQLGSANRTFEVENGTAEVDLLIGGGTTGGGSLIKEGSGLLELSGTHSYSATTAEVNEGVLRVTGAMTVDGVTVASGATLSGSGSIVGNVTTEGVIRAEEGIATFTLAGDHMFNGSLEATISPAASDLIDVVGSVVINPGALLDLTALNGTYSSGQSFTVIHTTEGVSGMFQTLIDESFRLIDFQDVYTALDVLVEVVVLPFSTVGPTGNAKAVAKVLDALDPPPGSDLELVESQLRELGSDQAIIEALDQLQPANLRSLSLAIEEGSLRLAAAAMRRFWDPCCLDPCCWSLWLFETGSFSTQKSIKDLQGFDVVAGQIALGIERPTCCGKMGAALAYSYSHLDLDHHRGDGDLHSVDLLLYREWSMESLFLRGTLMGGYNHYSTERKVRFGTINRRPKASFDGGDFLASLMFGNIWYTSRCSWSPYLLVDYHFLHQGSFSERGAGSINNEVDSINDNLLRGMAGLHISSCWQSCYFKFAAEIDLAYAREGRLGSRTYVSRLAGVPIDYEVRGMHPDRDLFVPEVSFSLTQGCGGYSARLGYHGEIGRRYLDNQIFVDLALRF